MKGDLEVLYDIPSKSLTTREQVEKDDAIRCFNMLIKPRNFKPTQNFQMSRIGLHLHDIKYSHLLRRNADMLQIQKKKKFPDSSTCADYPNVKI